MRLPPNDDGMRASAGYADRNIDFSEYMWMGEEMEEFDSKCLLELFEEDFIESCFEELFEEEERFAEEMEVYLSNLTQEQVGSLVSQLDAVTIDGQNNADVKSLPEEDGTHLLNPDAPAFVPSSCKTDENEK